MFSLRSNVESIYWTIDRYDKEQSTSPLALLKAQWPASQAPLVQECVSTAMGAHGPTVLTNPEPCRLVAEVMTGLGNDMDYNIIRKLSFRKINNICHNNGILWLIDA